MTSNQLSNDELNRELHAATGLGCPICDALPGSRVTCYIIPDYCSDASPRSLLNEVVEKVIEQVGEATFWDALFEPFNVDNVRHATLKAATANAEHIARACVEAHKQENNDANK